MIRDIYKFVDWVINQSLEGCDADGGDIQEQAEACGLLKQQKMQEPCGENCACDLDYDVDFPVICWRKTYLENMKESEDDH